MSLSVHCEVDMISARSSHYHSVITGFIKYRTVDLSGAGLVTQVVPEKMPLSECYCCCAAVFKLGQQLTSA